MTRPIRVGIIGVGRIGQLHAHLLAEHPNVALISIADHDVKKAERLAHKLQVHHVTRDAMETMAKDLDAVAITSSTDTHASLICHAAAAGLHVFCEKPVDLSLASTLKVKTVVGDAGIKLQLGFNRRFDEDFLQVQRTIKEGKVGRIHIVRLTSRDPCPPPVSYIRHSGGLFLDMMIHDFDMARFLVGDEVESLFAFGDALVDPKIGLAGDLDTAAVTMRFRNGAICTIDNSRRAVYGYDQRAEVLGDRGCAMTGPQHLNAGHFWDADAEKRDLSPDFFIRRYRNAYRAQMNAFISSIIGNQSPSVGLIDGLRALELGLAANTSLKSGQMVAVQHS